MGNVICCDLDEVVFDFLHPFISYMQQEAYKVGVSLEKLRGDVRKWTSWDGYENFGLNRDQFLSIYKTFCDNGFFKRMPLVENNASSYINKVCKQNTVIFVTIRPPSIIEHTMEALSFYGIDSYYGLVHVGRSKPGELNAGVTLFYHRESKKVEELPSCQSKQDVFNCFKPHMVIDDKPEYLLEAVLAGSKHNVIMAKLHNSKWRKIWFKELNRSKIHPLSLEFASTLMTPVYNWKQIDILLELKKEKRNEENNWFERQEGLGKEYVSSICEKHHGAR